MKRVLLGTLVQDRGTKREAWVDLWVDAERLLGQLGTKAIRSKGKKAQMASGAVSAVVRKHTLADTVV